MRMGDWIMFRGTRRFLVGVRSHGCIMLERIQKGRFPSPCVHYSVGAKELSTITVIEQATPSSRRRARRLVEDSCSPWTRVVWHKGSDAPAYVHSPL